jgi:DNA polymerase I
MGYVRTLIGRKRRIKNLDSEDSQERKGAERQAVNTIVQGTAADIIKGAMIKIHNDTRLNQLGIKTLIQVHDELVMLCKDEDVEEAIGYINEDMIRPFNKDLKIPLEVDIIAVKYWGDAK